MSIASDLASAYQHEAKFADSKTVGPTLAAVAAAACGTITGDPELTSGAVCLPFFFDFLPGIFFFTLTPSNLNSDALQNQSVHRLVCGNDSFS